MDDFAVSTDVEGVIPRQQRQVAAAELKQSGRTSLYAPASSG